MKQRCENPNDQNFKHYGLRGIEVRFRSAEELVSHIGLPPPGYVIDRIDNDGHYERDNVRWTDQATSLANRRGWAGRRAKPFTEDQVRAILALAKQGLTQGRIATLFGARRRRINAVLNGRAFSHITGIKPGKKLVRS